MTKLSINNEDKVQFLLSWWGNGISIGFKGDPLDPEGAKAAIERCYNWAHNTGVTKGQLHWIYEKGSSVAYILTTFADLTKGLIAQFRAEIIMSREILPLVDRIDEETEEITIEYDEKAIFMLAEQRAEAFMKDKIINENFMVNAVTSVAPIYAVGHLNRAESSDE